jgi:hypothetical protein
VKIHVTNTLRDLAADTRAIPAKAHREMVGVVREGVRVGATVARDIARRSSGRHGKHYPRSITAGKVFGGFGVITGKYGPDPGKPQGGMSFERGSRKQKPHRDLVKSLDVVGPAFRREVREIPDRVFW